MLRRPPRSTRTDTLVPYTTLFRSNLGQHPAHILGVEEEDQSPMRSDPWATEHAFAHRLELCLGGVDVGDFVAHMMLPPRRILLQKPRDRGVAGQRLDQLDLRPVEAGVSRRIDETQLDRKSTRLTSSH